MLNWWTENKPKHRMIVAGLNTTAIGAMSNYNVADAGNKNWPASEIVKQIEIARQHNAGHIHWNMGALMKNKGGVDDALLRSEYNQPALGPALNSGGPKPTAPKLTAHVTK